MIRLFHVGLLFYGLFSVVFEFVTLALFLKRRVFQLFEIFSMLTAVFHSSGGEKFSAYAECYDSWCVSEFSLIHFI